ncbi:hypothetical protein [Dactylosporangium sp. NPDC051484]|uniref:hypothetical protein n=1 Tax=Dactylosporangium sp. NPDC051484 TaxID=3154942 RepID=UPI00344C8AB3
MTDGTSIRTVNTPDDRTRLGIDITRSGARGRLARLRTTRGIHLWLGVDAELFADEDGHATVEKSTWTLVSGQHAETEMLHYDYERAKDGYPEAHFNAIRRRPDKAVEGLLDLGYKLQEPALD